MLVRTWAAGGAGSKGREGAARAGRRTRLSAAAGDVENWYAAGSLPSRMSGCTGDSAMWRSPGVPSDTVCMSPTWKVSLTWQAAACQVRSGGWAGLRGASMVPHLALVHQEQAAQGGQHGHHRARLLAALHDLGRAGGGGSLSRQQSHCHQRAGRAAGRGAGGVAGAERTSSQLVNSTCSPPWKSRWLNSAFTVRSVSAGCFHGREPAKAEHRNGGPPSHHTAARDSRQSVGR